MGHFNGGAHETKGKSTRCMDELFRNIGAEKGDGNTVLGERRGNFSVSLRSDRLELF
jgi:hypothetical protein